MNLDKLLQVIWPKVRGEHLYPELPTPHCAEDEQRVGMDIRGKQISISREFVGQLSDVMGAGDVLEGLLDHAVSHYLYCPWDFSTHMKLYSEAKKILKNKQTAQRATDLFMDVVADTYCLSKKETPIPEIYRHLPKGEVDQVMHALCQRIWGVDLGVEGHDSLSRKLSRLPYLDRSRWRESVRRFARAVQVLLEEEEQEGSADGEGSMDSHGLQQYSAEEIARGLQELARDASSPKEFKEIVRDYEEELAEAGDLKEEGMGYGPGKSLDADILFYMKLAENYLLPIRKTPMEKSGSLYPHHHVSWEISRPYRDIDPWTSFGKIMPGITQTWQCLEGEVAGKEEGTPDCIVIIDSSGSMTEPRRHLSHAVLGGACAGDAYLRNGAEVAVYNFSDAHAGGARVLQYSRNRKKIYRTLCHYFGGGTQLRLEHIEGLQGERNPDIFVITDMQITNLEAVIGYFNDCENRVTAVHIGDNKRARIFSQCMSTQGNVSIFSVKQKEDIPRIVLGKVREYLYR
jgi:hypothetical protein